MDRSLFRRILHFERFKHAPGEARRAIPARRQLRLEAAYHHGLQLLAVNPDAAREALAVQQFQQGGKALGIAVMGRGREEKLVLEVRRDPAQSTRAVRVGRVLSPAGGRDIMRLVYDEQVEATRVGWLAARRQHLAEEAQRAFALEEVNRGDQAREVRPGVDVQAALAPQRSHQVAVDDAELQAEFIAHLLAPLHL